MRLIRPAGIRYLLLRERDVQAIASMFGGGVSSNLSGSSVAEKNLDRLTVICGLVWIISIVGIGLLLKIKT